MPLAQFETAILVSLAFAFVMAGTANAQTGDPVLRNRGGLQWLPIETELQPLDYKLYDAPRGAASASTCTGAGYNCEILQTEADAEYTPQGVQRIRPPAFSYFVTNYPIAPALAQFGGCTYSVTPSGMVTVASPFSATRGMMWQGYVDAPAQSSPAGAYSIAVVYSSSNECSISDQEYGFFTDTTQSGRNWRPYYSTATNTPGQQTSTLANSPVLGNVQSNNGGMIYFLMYVIPARESATTPVSDTGWDFRVEILNEDHSFAKCTIGAASTALVDCIVDLAISRMTYGDGSPAGQWPVNSDGTIPGQAFVTAGTQTSAWEGIIPVYSCGSCANAMWTNGLWLGFDRRRPMARPGDNRHATLVVSSPPGFTHGSFQPQRRTGFRLPRRTFRPFHDLQFIAAFGKCQAPLEQQRGALQLPFRVLHQSLALPLMRATMLDALRVIIAGGRKTTPATAKRHSAARSGTDNRFRRRNEFENVGGKRRIDFDLLHRNTVSVPRDLFFRGHPMADFLAKCSDQKVLGIDPEQHWHPDRHQRETRRRPVSDRNNGTAFFLANHFR